MTPEPFVRPYRPTDRPAVGRICVLTAHNGGDATPHYADPGILPTIFAYPYVDREPELAFVVDDGNGEATPPPSPRGSATTGCPERSPPTRPPR
jgi:hypothetical protein